MSNVRNNAEVAFVFNQIADILEIQGENAFKIRAYRNAVATLETLEEPVAQIAVRKELDKIPGFGDAIQAKTTDIVLSGTTPLYERLKEQVPAGVISLLALPGIGAKTVRQVWQGLGVTSVEALELAAKDGKIAALPGMGEKTAKKILDSIERGRRYANKVRIDEALGIAESMVMVLNARPEVEKIDIAGSVRRGVETIETLHLTASTRTPTETLAAFTELAQVARVIVQENRTVRVALTIGIDAELTVALPDNYALLLFQKTGSEGHLSQIQTIAGNLGLTITERGILKGETQIPVQTEDELYGAFGLPPIAAELRENTGEIEAAQSNTLPKLIVQSDIRGDVHAHTTASDGTESIERMALAAKARGYEYMAITDHSQSLTIASGLKPDDLRAQIAQIRRFEDKLGIRIFAGSEVDIKADGSMDYDDALLDELDFVIASAHLYNNQDKAAQTARLIRAIENPYVDLIAHPTGRLLNRRDPYDLDMEAVIDVAVRTNTALEINAAPERLDLKDEYVRQAISHGAKIMINTDAHSIANYDLMHYGITVARRAWVRAEDVLNTLPLADFEAWLKR